MSIVEREAQLGRLNAALDAASRGSGSVVLVSGEAGLGKTTLVRSFLERQTVRTLWSACDDLATARALGPIRDLARQSHRGLQEALQDKDPVATFEALLEELHLPPTPTVLVIEDVRIDEASADALKFVGRRIAAAPALMIVTGRSDELKADHIARIALADVPPHALHRIELRALSPAGIAELGAISEDEADRIHQLTGGNPFFVAEVISAQRDEVPASVVDAVLGKARQLDEEAVGVLELVSCVPSRAERQLVEASMPRSDEALAACEAVGLVELDRDFLWFRHELARQAVESTLPETRREALNGLLLVALEDMQADPARLVHHAEAAADRAEVARWASVAARQAASVRSHREAAEHFARAVELLDRYEPAEAADMVEGLARENYTLGKSEQALEEVKKAIQLRRALDDPYALGATLVLASRTHWFLGERQEAEAAGEDAIALLEPHGPSPGLARAYSNRTQLAMLWGDTEATEEWGDVAISMAREVGDLQVLGHALNNVGAQRAWKTSAQEGIDLLEEAREIAVENGYDEDACRAYTNLAWEQFLARLMEPAMEAARQGLQRAVDTQQTSFEIYLRASLALFQTVTGELREAEANASFVMSRPEPGGISIVPAAVALGLVEARRGKFEDARSLLEEGWALAEKTQEIQRTSPAALARAELAWLEGRDDEMARYIDEVDWSQFAAHEGHLHDEAAMMFWYRRAGRERGMTREWPEPYGQAVRGHHRAGAEILSRMGAHYEAAEMLMDSDDPREVEDAIARFESMGAPAAAERVRGRLAELQQVTRTLSTVLFTDIVDSTARATELGDAAWREVLDQHDDIADSVVAKSGGRLIKLTGDGIMARFDAPSNAVRAAIELRKRLLDLDIPIRAAVHTGEIEIRGEDIGGLAVHIASRLLGVADGIVASSTTKDLSAGSGLVFSDLGQHQLKGVDGLWHAYRVDSPSDE